MTDADTVIHFGPNGYSKPTLGLNILRESILGRELFDHAFKEYSRRWMFKRPTPYDFFRTMEDASGVDLDWFWRGWFYSIDHVDIALEKVTQFELDTRDPNKEKPLKKEALEAEGTHITVKRNKPIRKAVDEFPELLDFYNEFDPLDVTPKDEEDYKKLLKGLSEEERGLLSTRGYFYVLEFRNVGGMAVPLPLEIELENGRKKKHRLPAEIWRTDNTHASTLFQSKRRIISVTVDPDNEFHDVNRENNRFPKTIAEKRFQLRKDKEAKNPMQLDRDARKSKKDE